MKSARDCYRERSDVSRSKRRKKKKKNKKENSHYIAAATFVQDYCSVHLTIPGLYSNSCGALRLAVKKKKKNKYAFIIFPLTCKGFTT
jgi:hypothetical protein